MYLCEPVKLEINQKKIKGQYLFSIKIEAEFQKLESTHCYNTFEEARDKALEHMNNMLGIG